MIKAEEVLMGREAEFPIDLALAINLGCLLASVNYVRGRYGRPLSVSSGYRPGYYNKAAGGSDKSCHKELKAIDLRDPDGEFAAWCLAHLHELEKAGLYMENPEHTKGWVHLQNRPPESGSRVFIP